MNLFYLFSILWLFNILPFSYPFLQFSHVGSTEIYSQIKNLNKFYWRLINNPNKKGSVSYGKLSWYLQSLLSSHIFLHLQNLSRDHQYPPWRHIIKAEENHCRPDHFQCDNHPPPSKTFSNPSMTTASVNRAGCRERPWLWTQTLKIDLPPGNEPENRILKMTNWLKKKSSE